MRGKVGRTDPGNEGGDRRRKRAGEAAKTGKLNKQASEGALPSEARLFPVCGLFCGQRQKPKFKLSKIVVKNKKTPAFYAKSGCFVELLGGFEPPTSSLPTGWEPSNPCVPTLSGPFCSKRMRSAVLFAPLFPYSPFPVWVSVWVNRKTLNEYSLDPPFFLCWTICVISSLMK